MLISDSTLCLHAEEKLKNNGAGPSYRIVAIETPVSLTFRCYIATSSELYSELKKVLSIYT